MAFLPPDNTPFQIVFNYRGTLVAAIATLLLRGILPKCNVSYHPKSSPKPLFDPKNGSASNFESKFELNPLRNKRSYGNSHFDGTSGLK